MGIVNVTDDSFYGGSRASTPESVEERVRCLLGEGADMIDIGAYSSRPGADDVSEDEERLRLSRGLRAVRKVSATVPVSVDTFRSSVARCAVSEWGADIVNDISGGELDCEMFRTVAELGVPYILMHMRGTPQTMQSHTDYENVVGDVIYWLAERLKRLELEGVADVIVDPGFGFSKTLEQNYELLGGLHLIGSELRRPVLVGVSRKSMITRLLGIDTDGALNGTTCLNTMALMQGASFLRVHDAAEAVQVIRLTEAVQKNDKHALAKFK